MKKTHPQEWQCEVCNGKVVSLTNLFGSWPIAAYHKLSDLEKTSFWAESGIGKRNLAEAVEEKIVFKQAKQLIDDNVGKFLPMDAWVKQGWPKEFVEKCPCEEHKNGGLKTYQVAVHSTGTKSIQELVRNEMSKLLGEAKLPKKDHQGRGGGRG